MLKDDKYSTLVAIFKVMLPCLALIILSALFLLPDNRTKIQALNTIDKSTLNIVKKAGVNKPSFRGTLASGSNLELYATEIITKNNDKNIIEINEISARLELNRNNWATASAKKGVVNISEQTAEMVGKVSVKSSNGVLIETSDLKVFYAKSLVKTEGAVFMKGPFGTIKAGSAEFYDMNQNSGTGYVLLFNKGVKMQYHFGE
ncbi:MAG: LPS export ABC transporter periplasmic protein LptC [Paracoccaceae bacterium]|nr:LPS export ABC transporter periplasmic protein LptC [Paracoccaceae bacterium]